MKEYNCSDESSYAYSFKPFLQATSGSYGDIQSKERLIDLFKHVLPKALKLTSFILELDSRKTWVTPEAVIECLTLLKYNKSITKLIVICWPESPPIRDAVYRWLNQDNRLITFAYHCHQSDVDYQLERFARVAGYHPTLRRVYVDYGYDVENAYLEHEVTCHWLGRHRMVQLLAEPPIPKDILRHIFTFIK
jgi:predicted DCC family thiol-disulfide oxidoreductase YuxK